MKGVINIFGEIGQDVKLVDVISQVRQQPEATSFKVIIGSEGGLVSEGFDIYEYLISLKKPVETVGVGMVASIATIIFMAGDSRKVNPGTKFMIHFPFIPEVQNATAEHFEYYAKEMKIVEKRISNFYKEKTGLETEAIDPLLRNETYLSETQLFDLGFITEKTQQIQAVAKLKTTNNMADNKQKSDLSKSILKTISDFFKGDATMKILTTADQAEVNFPDVPDEREVAIGDIATIDGAPASGEVTMSDGRIFVFDAGTLTEIRDPEDDTDETIEEMKAEIEKLKSSLAEKDEKINALNSEKEKAVEVINKIKMLQSSAAGSETKEKPGKGDTKAERPLAGAISKLRKAK